MSFQTILVLSLIGIFAGIMSGFIGVGGGVIIVPALVYFLSVSQHTAIGTSLLIMLPPIGILAAMNYYKAGQVNVSYALLIAATFIIGAYFGSKLSLRLSANMVKFVFGIFMLYVSVRMIYTSYKGGLKHETTHTTENTSDQE